MKEKYTDESGDRKYFTIIPNYILNHSTLWDREVYIQMKRIAGENGTCWRSRNTMAKQCGISLDRYKKSVKYLVEHGWIKKIGTREVETKGGTQEVNEYKIIDLWDTNNSFYKEKYKGGSSETLPTIKGGSSISQGGVVESVKGGSSESHKEEPLEEEPFKKIERELTPSQKTDSFFKGGNGEAEEVIAGLVSKGIPEPIAESELRKFVAYWTEPSSTGKQLRWQGEKYFDLSRRLTTWITRAGQYQKSNTAKSSKVAIIT